MKSVMIVMLSLLASGAFAEEIRCTVKMNAEEAVRNNFTIEPGTSALFADTAEFRFYLHHLGKQKFEIDVFEPLGPSRNYAAGYLRTKEDILTWTLWTRDYLIEASCQLNSSPTPQQ